VQFTLHQILGLVGTLDDAPRAATPRERFRGFLRFSGINWGSSRLRRSLRQEQGSAVDHALQDLVNHTGAQIGFAVEFGRYKGIQIMSDTTG
jgi:hypothetical protein